jgi:uncharacterized damage-inducible protein DinB
MTHPLVTQLRFARNELVRALDGMTDEEARRRFEPMNCISWMVGHLANQENTYWVFLAQGQILEPGLRDLVGYGKPASTPPLEDMWAAWRNVTGEADKYLDTLKTNMLTTHFDWQGEPMKESIGTMLQRVIFHYWYHIGESQAVRQLLGHNNLPEFVGDIDVEAPYRPE